jgi:hypothetical protein
MACQRVVMVFNLWETTAFQLEFTRIAVQRYEISLIVYDSVNEVIVQWIR